MASVRLQNAVGAAICMLATIELGEIWDRLWGSGFPSTVAAEVRDEGAPNRGRAARNATPVVWKVQAGTASVSRMAATCAAAAASTAGARSSNSNDKMEHGVVQLPQLHEELGFGVNGGALFWTRNARQDARIWGLHAKHIFGGCNNYLKLCKPGKFPNTNWQNMALHVSYKCISASPTNT
eukprot:365130-Chlamydomonas_euryale.AAC.5